jgi:hypothetical protein
MQQRDQSAKQAQQLLYQWLDVGLLEADLGLDAASPSWADGLGTWLTCRFPASNPVAAAVLEALPAFAALETTLREGTAPARQAAQQQAVTTLDTLRGALRQHATGLAARQLTDHPAFLAWQPHQLFFEDTYCPPQPSPANQSALESIAETIQELVGSHDYFDENALPRHRLYEAYTHYFGLKPVALLTAYAHYRAHGNWAGVPSANFPTDAQRAKHTYRGSPTCANGPPKQRANCT